MTPLKHLSIALAAFGCATHLMAASLVEQYVITAAKAANDSLKNAPKDGVTKSIKAYAQGSTLVHEHVLSLRPDVSERELQLWRSGTRSEVVPGVCSHLKQDEFFNKHGFQVRYRYLNQSGKVLDDFVVNRPACQGL
ncbi:hypothetical protein [Comamonas serinivorans]|uniref:hypothetical protein n=1 Tax=Comamonas serinivorans TaxID=1082851 RepID=UPI0012F77A22|nr:hypothetical protein [Comamonas serinivorans]